MLLCLAVFHRDDSSYTYSDCCFGVRSHYFISGNHLNIFVNEIKI